MTKGTRLTILIVCIVCFFVIAPILVAYSMGYRFDFEKMEITETGGIYVRTFPAAGQITIDSKISEKPGFLGNSIFVQSLLPKNHTVSIKKSGYYDYFKTLPVQEKQVTKLENVLLIKKSIAFNDLSDNVDYFSVAPNNQNIITSLSSGKGMTFNYFNLNNNNQPQTFSIVQSGNVYNIKWSDDSNLALIDIQNSANNFYYLFDTTQSSSLQKPTITRLSYLDKNSQQISFSPQNSQTIFYINNKTLYSAKGNDALPILNNVLSFRLSGSNIIWLSSKGAMSNSDMSGKLANALSLGNFPVNAQKKYEIISVLGDTFLKENDTLFKFDQNKKTFTSLDVPIRNYKILSVPDGKNLIYWNDKEIYLYAITDATPYANKKYQKIFSGNQITNCQLLNNDYIIFSDGDKIIISEIDYRGNINTVTLPQTVNINSTNPLSTTGNPTEQEKIDIKNPTEFFDQQIGKLYILTGTTLLSSEKITP